MKRVMPAVVPVHVVRLASDCYTAALAISIRRLRSIQPTSYVLHKSISKEVSSNHISLFLSI